MRIAKCARRLFVKPVPASAVRGYVRPMKVVFTSWLTAIAVGLLYMYAIALSGR